MDYKDILDTFEYRFEMEEDEFVFDVRTTCPMVFRFNGREVLGSCFKDKIYFYELI